MAVDAADVVVHAGDWVTTDLLDDLESVAARLIGVYGNNDGPELQARLPEVARAELDGVRLAVVHETGGAQGGNSAAPAPTPTPTCWCSGTATSRGTRSRRDGLRLLNPGSPTDRRRQPTFTWMTAEIVDGKLGAVELHHRNPA